MTLFVSLSNLRASSLLETELMLFFRKTHLGVIHVYVLIGAYGEKVSLSYLPLCFRVSVHYLSSSLKFSALWWYGIS